MLQAEAILLRSSIAMVVFSAISSFSLVLLPSLAGPQWSPQKISGKKQCWSTSSPSFFSGLEVPFVSHSCFFFFVLCPSGPFLDTFSQKCHQRLRQTQLCPEVGPPWSWLGPAVSCTGQPLVSAPRGHPAAPRCQRAQQWKEGQQRWKWLGELKKKCVTVYCKLVGMLDKLIVWVAREFSKKIILTNCMKKWSCKIIFTVWRGCIRQIGEGEGYKPEFTGEGEMWKRKLFSLPVPCISAICPPFLMQTCLLLILCGRFYVQLILWTSS